MLKAFYFGAVLYYLFLPDFSSPRQYTGRPKNGSALGRTQSTHSVILPIPTLIFRGPKSAKFGLNFRTHSPLSRSPFEIEHI